MPHVCPKTCGRLATAAVLISVGVVQLIAGLILIRSKYVFLLSALDFWTSASNFAVGGLLGVSASVWKETGKISPKHATRRKILAALMFSCIMINATTAAILILGEENTLLSIQLERNGVYSSATLASELLAYAYAASVCSPIICVVIACVFLSGLCFRRKANSIESIKTKKVLDEDDPYRYNWVFKQKQIDPPQPDPQVIRRALSNKFPSSSSDDESVGSSDTLHQCKSSSAPSVESLNDSSHIAMNGIRARSEGNLFHQRADHEEQTVGTEGRSLPRVRNKVSFIDESLNGGWLSKEMLLKLPLSSSHFVDRRHSNMVGQRATHDHEMSTRNLKFKTKTDIPFEHSNFEDIEMCKEIQANRFSRRAPIKTQYQQDYKPTRQSLISADVYIDGRKFTNNQGYTNYSYSLDEPTLYYEAGTSSRENFEKDNGYYAHSKIRRTSTARSLKSLESMDETRSEPKPLYRTYNEIIPNPPEENWNFGITSFDQTKSNRDAIHQKSSFSKIPRPSMQRQPTESEMDASTEIVDASFDWYASSDLAGKVVPIRVSTLPRKLSSKLIPVTMPAVSSSRKYSLKGAESSDTNNFKSMIGNARRDTTLVRTNRFENNGEPKLLSFRGGVKSKEYRNRKTRSTILPRTQPDASHQPAPPLNSNDTEEEQERRCCPSSPAHTSGYLSALEETLDSTGKSRSAETSVLSAYAGKTPQKKHWTASGKTSQDMWESPEIVKEMVTQIIEEGSERHSKKELIDKLLNDPAFQRMVKQTLKETEV